MGRDGSTAWLEQRRELGLVDEAEAGDGPEAGWLVEASHTVTTR